MLHSIQDYDAEIKAIREAIQREHKRNEYADMADFDHRHYRYLQEELRIAQCERMDLKEKLELWEYAKA